MGARLNHGWSAYCQNCERVHSIFDFKRDSSDILLWNYQVFLHLDDEYIEDHSHFWCRYCGTTSRACGCNGNLGVLWEVAEAMTLGVPSLVAAEHVFLLANNLATNKQGSMLADSLLLSLFLSFNKRPL